MVQRCEENFRPRGYQNVVNNDFCNRHTTADSEEHLARLSGLDAITMCICNPLYHLFYTASVDFIRGFKMFSVGQSNWFSQAGN